MEVSISLKHNLKHPVLSSGGSRIPRWGGGGRRPVGGGANLKCVHFLAKTYAKMKEMDPVWGAPVAPPWIRQCLVYLFLVKAPSSSIYKTIYSESSRSLYKYDNKTSNVSVGLTHSATLSAKFKTNACVSRPFLA